MYFTDRGLELLRKEDPLAIDVQTNDMIDRWELEKLATDLAGSLAVVIIPLAVTLLPQFVDMSSPKMNADFQPLLSCDETC